MQLIYLWGYDLQISITFGNRVCPVVFVFIVSCCSFIVLYFFALSHYYAVYICSVLLFALCSILFALYLYLYLSIYLFISL